MGEAEAIKDKFGPSFIPRILQLLTTPSLVSGVSALPSSIAMCDNCICRACASFLFASCLLSFCDYMCGKHAAASCSCCSRNRSREYRIAPQMRHVAMPSQTLATSPACSSPSPRAPSPTSASSRPTPTSPSCCIPACPRAAAWTCCWRCLSSRASLSR